MDVSMIEVDFENLEDMDVILGDERIAMLRLIHSKKPGSIRETAELLDQDYLSTFTAIEELHERGIVELVVDDSRNAPRVTGDEIVFTVDLVTNR